MLPNCHESRQIYGNSASNPENKWLRSFNKWRTEQIGFPGDPDCATLSWETPPLCLEDFLYLLASEINRVKAIVKAFMTPQSAIPANLKIKRTRYLELVGQHEAYPTGFQLRYTDIIGSFRGNIIRRNVNCLN